MVAVKRNWFSWLNRPISVALFGRNKTVRGVIAMIGFTWLGGILTWLLLAGCMSMSVANHWMGRWGWVGAILGLLYILGEFPNSIVKRRLGIQAGTLPAGGRKWVFGFVDYADSFLPITLFCAFVFGWGFWVSVYSFFVFVGLAFVAKLGLKGVGLK